jgi:lipid A 4'-phosphatase
MKNHLALKLLLPLLLFLIIAPFTPEIDLFLSKQFFSENQFSFNPLWDLFYHYGIYPAWFGALICLILLVKKKQAALIYLLTFAIGAGTITQGIFKTFWQRPRPLQTDLFGGSYAYHPFWKYAIHANDQLKSLPCGHCTMGFQFFSLILMGIFLKNKYLTFLGLFLTFFFGFGLSVARLAKGGHYFSDILIGMLIMWFSAVISEEIIKLSIRKNALDKV